MQPGRTWSIGGQRLRGINCHDDAVARCVTERQQRSTDAQGKPTLDATFNGTHLNTKIWDTCYPGAEAKARLPELWQSRRSRVVPALAGQGFWWSIAAHGAAEEDRRHHLNGRRESYGCRSGMITSYPSFKFKYGFVQVVANIPHANGLWSALWLAAANDKFPPEIDMVESWGVNGETGSFFHPVIGHHSRAIYSPKLTVGWHTYSLSWTKSKLTFYVDKKLVLTVTKNVPHQRMYFLADLAEYMPAKRGYCTGQLHIKSVKIWKA